MQAVNICYRMLVLLNKLVFCPNMSRKPGTKPGLSTVCRDSLAAPGLQDGELGVSGKYLKCNSFVDLAGSGVWLTNMDNLFSF